ncbi:MAG: hypothetical protein QXV17_09275 [Candidatus Micrarchaeaceae archaeon]
MNKKKEIDDLLKKNEEIFKMLGSARIELEDPEQVKKLLEKKKMLRMLGDAELYADDDLTKSILKFIDTHWEDLKKLLCDREFVTAVAIQVIPRVLFISSIYKKKEK